MTQKNREWSPTSLCTIILLDFRLDKTGAKSCSRQFHLSRPAGQLDYGSTESQNEEFW